MMSAISVHRVLLLVVTLALRSLGTAEVSGQSCQGVYAAIGNHTACLSPAHNIIASGIDPSTQGVIVNKHNVLRGTVFPTSSNMIYMVWDNEVAMIAQKWAEQCTLSHDVGFHRHIPGRFPYIGQNLAWGYNEWEGAIQGWFDEVVDFNYGIQIQGGVVGHYTQVVWATSSSVGCGFANCDGEPYYVCNYAPGGNLHTSPTSAYTPYESGTPCDTCPDRCISNACECDKVCYNGGTLNVATCECSCTDDFYDLEDCKLDCAATIVEPGYCNTAYTEEDCRKFSNVPSECPIRCGACEAGGFVDARDTTPSNTTTTTIGPVPGECPPEYAAIVGHSRCLPEMPTDPALTIVRAGVSEADVNNILQFHNFQRAFPQPPAADMKYMRWDDELALVAQGWVDTCPSSSDLPAARIIPGVFVGVGQNLGSSLAVSSWPTVLNSWYLENTNFIYGGSADQQLGRVDRYAQMVSSEAYRIGCGFAQCENLESGSLLEVYVCNYAPASPDLAANQPYVTGPPCEGCAGICVLNTCDCGDDAVCVNGGELTLQCTCECVMPYHDPTRNCQVNCALAVEDPECGRSLLAAGCPLLEEHREKCPYLCGICISEPDCGCPSVHVTGPGAFRDSVGIYTVQACQVADRPVYMRTSDSGERYLYFDEVQRAWAVQTELEGGDTVFRAASTEHRPYYVSAPWEVRQNNNNSFVISEQVDVECMCGKPICQELEIETSEPTHRFPASFLFQNQFNDRPFYQMQFRSQRALLFFHTDADCSFWKVGDPFVMDGVMMSYDVSAQPADVKAPWLVAGANGVWAEDSTLRFRCLHY